MSPLCILQVQWLCAPPRSLGMLMNEKARDNGCARKFEAVIVREELASCRRDRRRGHCGYLGTIRASGATVEVIAVAAADSCGILRLLAGW